MKLRKFIRGERYFFQMLDDDRNIVLESQAYTSKDARDNGIESVRENISNPGRYEVFTGDGDSYFILKAANGQEIGRSRTFSNDEEREETMEYSLQSRSKRNKTDEPSPGPDPGQATAPAVTNGPEPEPEMAEVTSPPQEDGGEAYGTDGNTDDYKPLDFYENNGNNVSFGFDSFHADGEDYFSFSLDGLIYLISEGYKSDSARDHGIESVKKNMDNDLRYQRQEHPNGQYFFNLRAGNNQEIATSRWFESEGDMNAIIERMVSGDIEAPKKKRKKRTSSKPKTEKIYLADGNYHGTDINYQLFRSGNEKHYFTFKNSEGKTLLLNSDVRGFETQDQGQDKINQVLVAGTDRDNYESKTTKNDKFYFYLKGDGGINIAKSVFFSTENEMNAAIDALTSGEVSEAGGTSDVAAGTAALGTMDAPSEGGSDVSSVEVEADDGSRDSETTATELEPTSAEEDSIEDVDVTEVSEEVSATKADPEGTATQILHAEDTLTEVAEGLSEPDEGEEENQVQPEEGPSEVESSSDAEEEEISSEDAAVGDEGSAVSEDSKDDEDASGETSSTATVEGGFKWWWIPVLIVLLLLVWLIIRSCG